MFSNTIGLGIVLSWKKGLLNAATRAGDIVKPLVSPVSGVTRLSFAARNCQQNDVRQLADVPNAPVNFQAVYSGRIGIFRPMTALG